MSKQQVQTILEQANRIRINLSRTNSEMRQHLNFMQYKIRKQLSPLAFFSLCGADRSKFLLPSRFVAAFNSMTLLQRALFYKKTVIFSDVFLKEQTQKNKKDRQKTIGIESYNKKDYQIQHQKHTLTLLINQGFRSWSQKLVVIQGLQAKISTNLKINLRHYIIRKSKKKDRICYVLQAFCKQNPEVIRIAFKKGQEPQAAIRIIMNIMQHCHYLMVSKLMMKTQTDNQFKLKKQTMINSNKSIPNNQKSNRILNGINTQMSQNQSINDEQAERHLSASSKGTAKSIVQQILRDQNQRTIEDDQLPDLIDQENQKQNIQFQMLKTNQTIANKTKQQLCKSAPKVQSFSTIKLSKDIFSLIMPYYNLKGLADLTSYRTVSSNYTKNIYIYQHIENTHIFKMEFMVKLTPETTIKALYNVSLYKIWHGQVIQGQMKMLISTQNTAIMYQKHRSYNQWYKQRDFLYIRHVFKIGQEQFIVDKSIQNSNFLPFNSIVRGKINYCIWRISKNAENGSTITIQIDLDHEGLTKSYRQELTRRYLQGFQKLQNYYRSLPTQKKLNEYLSLAWEVKLGKVESHIPEPPPLISYCTVDFQGGSQISENRVQQQNQQEDIFYTITDIENGVQQEQIEVQKREITENDIFTRSNLLKFEEQQIDLDEQGYTILPINYLIKKHPVRPSQEKQYPKINQQFSSVILKDDWQLESKGGLKLVNRKKIQAQTSVMNHMMKALKKNLLSGKGFAGLSMPVQVFNQDSQLQRFSTGMTLAPQIFQKAIMQSKDPLERFKSCLIFGLSHSILSLDIEKPFNPILGETYQGQIAGCPIYGEQISHHPPISSILFIGRGFRIYGSLQVKGDVGMNSATGINQGFLTIEFQDTNQRVYFQSQPGQLSLKSEQKFQFIGKSFYYDPINFLFCQMKFQEAVGYFSKPTWQHVDMIEGQVVKINEDFLSSFLQAENKNKPSPTKKDIMESYCKVSGRWPIEMRIDNKVVYKISDDLPFELKDYPFPLNSNSNYREDIIYRKRNDIARCQIQKDRLQNSQRNDKKLRTKYKK